MAKFMEGQGVSWKHPISGLNKVGIVVNVGVDSIDVVPVYPMDKYTKCYDDVGAQRDRDTDNVRLKECPPPFSDFYREMRQNFVSDAYVKADVVNPMFMDLHFINRYGVSVVDDGKTVSQKMMEEIHHHPWPEQLERERVRELPSLSSEIENFEDNEFSM